jgi:hypothetical protein
MDGLDKLHIISLLSKKRIVFHRHRYVKIFVDPFVPSYGTSPLNKWAKPKKNRSLSATPSFVRLEKAALRP